MTTEQIYEHITKEQNKTFKKHPALSMSKGAAIDGMLEQAKREGAREALEEVEKALRKARDDDAKYDLGYGYCVRLNIAELKKKYEV